MMKSSSKHAFCFSNRAGFCCILTLVLLTSVTLTTAQHQSATVVSESERALTISLTPEGWRQSTVIEDGVVWTQIDFDGAVFDEAQGKPRIPYHMVILGIPIDARVEARVLEAEAGPQPEIKIAPYAAVERVDGWPERQLRLDSEIYENPGAFPQNLIKLQEPTFFRDQRIVRVMVAAAQFLPQQNRLMKFNRLRLEVSFVGGAARAQAESQQTRVSVSEENLYRKLLLNYEQARNWRKAREPKPLAKTSAGVQNTTLYRFSIQEEGIYKIDGALLQESIPALDLSTIDPDRIRLFNNGGRELPRDIDAPRPDGLVENAIRVVDGGDGSFDRDDAIIFYARGVNGWEFDQQNLTYEHYINHYTFSNTYWLELDGNQSGKRMASINSGASGDLVETYQGLIFVEEERENKLNSGLNWFGQGFAVSDVDRSRTWLLQMPNAIPQGEAQLRLRFAAINRGTHRFDVSLNGVNVGTSQFVGDSFGGQYLRIQISDDEFAVSDVLRTGENQLSLSYSHSASFGQAALDWFELLYPARLQAIDNELVFNVLPASGTQSYRVSGFSQSGIEVYDVTEYSNVRRIAGGSVSNGAITFSDVQDPNNPKRYVALTQEKLTAVEGLEPVEYRDIRNPQMTQLEPAEFVIITHNDFFSQAERLESFRENGSPDNRLITEVVRIDDIFNNFSGGLTDPTAIRDFLKHVYETWEPRPAYVLLFGDGTFDYKNSNANFVPTYQTDPIGDSNRRRLIELESRTTDSWYTYVSEENDLPGTPVMDMAIGRINCQTIAEAKNVVDKIIAYESQPLYGNWRRVITMVGDDELVTGGNPSSQDAALHIPQAENIATGGAIPKMFDIQKIYLSEFPKVTSAAIGGFTKPAAKEALLQQMNQGTLIVNYIGHGNSSLWAHERIFEASDNDRVQNQDKLIFFVAATCDWALFDNPLGQSQAEQLILAEDRGAIAMLSSARLVFSTTNFNFNRRYYQSLFTETGRTERIGDAFLMARLRNNGQENDEKYHIFGDPTLRLAVPQREAVITSMTPDSILALSTVTIEGEVRQAGALDASFDGTVFINTFDSDRFVRNQPEAGRVQEYFLPGNSIYRGTVPVTDGAFRARFIVPKDISYGGGRARVSTYFWNDEVDGAGFRDNITVSSSTANLVDDEGPRIRIYFSGHENFTTGDIIDSDVTMVVELADTVSGINIAGEIGHRLTLSIDPNAQTCLSQLNRFQGTEVIDLTDLFQFDEGDHLAGKVEFPLQFPPEIEIAGETVPCQALDGEQRHTLVVKAWDNANNSSVASVEVLVVQEEGLVLREVMNYPNPFRQQTTFTFFSNQDADVQIKIYTVAGRLVHTLEFPNARNGFNMVDWDGRDAQGDIPANGVYLYKLIAKTQGSDGPIQEEVIGRLAIIR